MLRHNLKKLYFGRCMSSLVEFTVNNTARRVTLNRPKKLNALNLEMCKAIVPTLQEYSKSDVNSVVILDSSSSPRAFCAGGDVAAVAEASSKGDKSVSHEFFKYEYSLNWLLAAYPKPIVAIMDGITMGGGVGLSIHVPFRIATENTKWAMPEMDIGLYPDVGVTFALPKITTVGGSEGQFAYYLCLTGDIVSGLDAYIAGLASHYVSSETVKDLEDRLGELTPSKEVNEVFESTNKAIMAFTSPIPSNYKFKYSNAALDVIERAFKLDTPVPVLLKTLEDISRSDKYSSETKEFAAETREKLLLKSPVSMEVAREQFRRNFFNDIQSAMKQDLITATNMSNQLELSEFAVSSKHKLILKNKTPYPWKLKDVAPTHVSRLISEDPSSSVSLLDVDAITFKKYLHHDKYHLPTESKVQSYITGTDQSGRSLAVTKAETIRYFTELNPISRGKPGVRELVSSIVDRKCDVDREGFLTWKY